MLGEHNITYRPRTSVKGQVLADFVAEMPDGSQPDASVVEINKSRCSWMDRHFVASNNKAEYEALIADLRIAAQMGVRNVHEGGNKVLYQGPPVRIIGGGSLQAVIPYAMVKVRRTTPSRKTPAASIPDHGSVAVLQWGIDIAGPFLERPVKHPQSNGLVGRVNQSLGEGIKARLGEGNKNWVEELPHVLWVYRTMIKSSHGDTPFSLTHGTKAIIPAEIRMPTYLSTAVDVVHNDEELRLNLDLLEERCECAAICEAKAKLKMTKYYNARVPNVTFRPGDFVYRSNDASHTVDERKLGPKWDETYEVTKALGDGAYKLRSMDGTVLPRTWNIANLKRCYL
uniref:Reverse transcriptase domain-containing protein n=1 Tax=Tanacetum cinerariifolium TaxID=118510 RepID=A0A699H8E3_TANCI|nr:reverse transcriptase domain-containing protein [Tanacetum cinerariifolium]